MQVGQTVILGGLSTRVNPLLSNEAHTEASAGPFSWTVQTSDASISSTPTDFP